MKEMRCSTFWANIYIAGPVPQIEQTCREWTLKGACVTVTPTNYVYTMGEESGAIIGLIHYPRFALDQTVVPKMETKEKILEEAKELGFLLLEKCCQGSFTIVTPDDTIFFSRREGDEKK